MAMFPDRITSNLGFPRSIDNTLYTFQCYFLLRHCLYQKRLLSISLLNENYAHCQRYHCYNQHHYC